MSSTKSLNHQCHCSCKNTSFADCEDVGDTVYWEATAQTALGQVTGMDLGNGLSTSQSFDVRTGTVDRIITTALTTGDRQDLDYTFDKLGNLSSREDYRIDRQETFAYDDINRLTSATVKDAANSYAVLHTNSVTYDALGNIQTKTGVSGTWQYGDYHNGTGELCEGTGHADPGPHAVTTANSQDYCYDANGNLTLGYNHVQSRKRAVTWSAYNKPTDIKEGSNLSTPDRTLTFTYGADRARIKQVNDDGTSSTTRYYVEGLFEKETRGTQITYVHYILANGLPVVQYKSIDDTVDVEETLYLHRDHLGSVSLLTDETGAIVTNSEQSYDAWGKRRNAGDWSDASGQLSNADSSRGFTDHEQLDEVSLVHMNGRVYDPELGRFMSADPFIQAPLNSQSYNRYSYTFNNPLSFTDPSGFECVFNCGGSLGGGFTGGGRTSAGNGIAGPAQRRFRNEGLKARREARRARRAAEEAEELENDMEVEEDDPFFGENIGSDGIDVAFTGVAVPTIGAGGILIIIGSQTEAGQDVLGDIGNSVGQAIEGFKEFDRKVREIQKALIVIATTPNGNGPDDEEPDDGNDKVLTPSQEAKQKGSELVKKFKQEGVGQGAGRSGGHGTPHKRAGAQLIRDANKLPKNSPLRKALKKEGKRLINLGKSINHR